MYLVALVVWVGGIIFFSFVGAPSTFQAVPVDMAGKVVGKIFPRYYLLGFVAGLVALAAFLGLARMSGQWGGLKVANALLLTAMLGTGLYAGTVVLRQANAVKQQIGSFEDRSQGSPELRAEFARLHRLAVILNGVVLVLGLAVLLVTATWLRL
ncbi:MAG TPA: DUF4149 domain-containing protein [Candidatus Sulfotelmatobacter sp.]|nr:DUF4149 domain-containing protein [Candidatus Sulfotelmatobacter sp.]